MSASIWAPGASVPIVDPNSEVKSQIFTASAGQTIFNITLFTYNPGAEAIEVFRDGLKLPSTSVTETSAASFTLAAQTGGEIIEVVGNVEVASAANSAVASAASAAAALVSELAADADAVAAAASAASAAASASVSFMTWTGAWLTATAYIVNNGVSINGASYVCVSAHTSGTFATDLAGAKWQILAAKGVDGLGSGDLVSTNNLSDLSNVVTARSNLGLGSAAVEAAGVFATSGHNHTGVYEPANANLLETTDLGVSVQAYDVDTAKLDVEQTWAQVQRTSENIVTSLTLDLDNAYLDFRCTPSAGGALTLSNIPASPLVQKGTITFVNGANYAITAHANIRIPSTMLATISVTGTYLLSYRTGNGVAYIVNSSILA